MTPSVRRLLPCLLALAVPAAGGELRVRAAEVAAPCAESAARAYESESGERVTLEAGAVRHARGYDVLLGSDVEMTRAVEGGDAVIGSDEPLFRVPWVLSTAPGATLRPAGLRDLARPDLEVVVPAGPEAYEARKALSAGGARVREARDAEALRTAPVALVPVTLAGPGPRVAVDLPPVPVTAAVAIDARRPEAAADFVAFLAGERGQRLFAACGPRP